MPAAQTIKQAKAAYKKRQGGNLTDTERRRIERELQLHDRAQSIKDRDRARAAATRRREAEQARLKTAQALVATQRKRDIFGHKSSQFHLGAFFTKASHLPMPIEKPAVLCDDEDDFGQLELDDEDLSALDVSADSFDTDESVFEALQETAAPEPIIVDPDVRRTEQYSLPDIDNFDDCFDSSTQIERELADNEPRHSLSLDSMYSFGLTSQDMKELETPTKTATDHALMPPPPIPQARSREPPPPTDITMTQLESFVDEDIHLSQL